MGSLQEYTEDLRASLNQRMEHALSDNNIKISDILSKTHAQMVADLTDPQEWYYSDAHRYLINFLHVGCGGPKRKEIRLSANETSHKEGVLSSFIPVANSKVNVISRKADQDGRLAQRVDNDDKEVKGHFLITESDNDNIDGIQFAVEGDKQVKKGEREKSQSMSSREPSIHEIETMRSNRKLKALESNSKYLYSARKKPGMSCTTFAENGKQFFPALRRPKNIAGKQQIEVNELMVLASSTVNPYSQDLPHNSMVPTKQTSIRKFNLPPEEKSTNHKSEQLVVFDRWIQPLYSDTSQLGRTTTGTKNEEKIQQNLANRNSQRASKSTQTEKETGHSFSKVLLFSVPFELSPNKGVHIRDIPHTFTLKRKTTPLRLNLTPCRARSPSVNASFQSLLDNTEKRLAGIEQQIENLCFERRFIHKAVTNNTAKDDHEFSSHPAMTEIVSGTDKVPLGSPTDNLARKVDKTFPYDKTKSTSTVDIGTNTPSAWHAGKQPVKKHVTGKTEHVRLTRDSVLSKTSQYDHYHSFDFPHAKGALYRPVQLIHPKSKQFRTDIGYYNILTHENKNNKVSPKLPLVLEYPTESHSIDASNETEECVIQSDNGTAISSELSREEGLHIFLQTRSMKPTLKIQTAKRNNYRKKTKYGTGSSESHGSNKTNSENE